MMGEAFFDCQIGIVGCRAVCLKGIMGVRDFEDNLNRREEVTAHCTPPGEVKNDRRIRFL